jgi:hypothetical protein
VLQLNLRKFVPMLLKVDQAEPVRELGSSGPSCHGCLTDFFGFPEAASLKIAQQEASICFFAFRRNLPGLLESLRSFVEVPGIESVLALAE